MLNAEPYLLDAAEVARALGSDHERGLAAEEAARRLARDGANELRAGPPVPGGRRVCSNDVFQHDRGLIYLIDRIKGSKLYAHVNLDKGERSELANLASSLL